MEAMAEQLASSQRHVVDEICRNYARWAPQLSYAPKPGERLKGGYNHHVQLIEGPSQRWVIRIDLRIRDSNQREQEIAIQTQAAACGIAPCVDFSDPRRGITVMEWISEQSDVDSTAAELAGLLRKIHTLPNLGKPVSSIHVLQSHQDCIDANSSLSKLLRAGIKHIDQAVSVISNSIATNDNALHTVLCHNDLLCANRLRRNDQLYALDWEYAAPGDPLFDLAVCASDLTGTVADELLERYLRRTATPAEQLRYKAQGLIYACIEACWFSLHQGGTEQAARSLDKLSGILMRGTSR